MQPQDDFVGLTDDDMIMVIGGHRGSECGLHNLERSELITMLKLCREKAKGKIKRERDAEADDDVGVVEGPSQNRCGDKKNEAIVLD